MPCVYLWALKSRVYKIRDRKVAGAVSYVMKWRADNSTLRKLCTVSIDLRSIEGKTEHIGCFLGLFKADGAGASLASFSVLMVEV